MHKAPCATPACPLAGQCEKLKSPWLSVSTALQQLQHRCVLSIILTLNPKHVNIPDARKKINSVPAKHRTGAHQGPMMEAHFKCKHMV